MLSFVVCAMEEHMVNDRTRMMELTQHKTASPNNHPQIPATTMYLDTPTYYYTDYAPGIRNVG